MAHVMSDHASVFEIEQQDVAQQGPRDVAQRRRCHAWQFVTRISNFFMETITGLMDYIIKEVQDVTITKVIKWVCSILMIFGGVVPFIPQYREIKRKGDAEGFSTYVCLVLIFANTLRILFWFGKRFELPLLIQSFVMNFVMLLMIHLCVTVRQKNQLIRGPDHTFTDFDIRYFWQWTDFQSYLDFVFILTAVCSLLTFLLMRFPMFIESLGFIALFTEAMLAVPQLIQNFRLQSTEGMSVLMILMWMVGDVFKTLYFVLREAPAQFWVCGGLQVFIDVVILYQVHLYKDHLSGLPSHAGRTD